ncbi:MAG: phenylacetate-CoA oxygenase subunit PaaC [Actinomycetota bacterium]|nr:phenylacetate-CoA oxygenase subunit PaaC [Actinomycetota bacterium]
MSEALVALLTALGDDELVIGHRHSEWTGFAPHIEEDVAFSSIAQDEIGHASAYYSIVANLTGDHPDRIALGRQANEYRNAILCERGNRDWSYTLARHWLYDTADEVRLESLENSSHPELAALVTKLRREERYHLIHARAWMTRIAHGPVEARTRLIDSLTSAFPETHGLFEPFESESECVERGWLPEASDALRERWRSQAVAALDELGLPTDISAKRDEAAEFLASSSGDLIEKDTGADDGADAQASGIGGRRGRHTEEFDELWDVMTLTYRSHEGATW